MRKLYVFATAYILGIFIFSIFSYSLTDPNLVLSNNEVYWQFQQWMWHSFFDNPLLQGRLFTFIFSYLVVTYLLLTKYIIQQNISKKFFYILLTFTSIPLFFSYNALSHDIFNYIFNAKMVWYYNLDPHIHTAIEKSYDDWLRFMHNVHTPAPYGYGWTAISLIPSILGFNKFVLTLINFKLLSLFSYIFLVFITIKKNKNNSTLLLLNPLLLIEVISSGHNDLFMMIPAFIALELVSKKRNIKIYTISILLFIFSVSIKFATLALLPLCVLLLLSHHNAFFKKYIACINLEKYWPLYASLLSFIPLLTERSQQFHPWYLIWPLIWIVYFPSSNDLKSWFTYWKLALVVLSFSSLFRYIPWIQTGGFSSTVIAQQKMVTWIPLLLFTIIYIFLYTLKWKQKSFKK